MSESQLKETKSRAIKVLIGCVLIVAINYSSQNAFTNYIGYICADFGCSPTDVTLVFSIAGACSGIGGLVAAAIVDRVPAKFIVIGGAVCYCLFYAIQYVGYSLPAIYVAAFFYGWSLAFAGYAICQPLITWWHATNTVTKISSMSVIQALFLMALSPAVVVLLEHCGYRTSIAIQGVVLGGIVLVAALLLVSNKPESYGLKPYGLKEEPASKDDASAAYAPRGLEMKRIVKTPSFWAILICPTLLVFVAAGFMTNASLIFQSFGYDAMGAAGLLSLHSGVALVWSLGYGFVSDRKGARFSNNLYLIVGIAIFAIAVVIGGVPAALTLAIFVGAPKAVSGMIGVATFRQLFGTKAIGTLVALGTTASAVGSMVCAPVASAMYEAAGSYTPFLLLCVGILAVVTVLSNFATSKGQTDKINAMIDEEN